MQKRFQRFAGIFAALIFFLMLANQQVSAQNAGTVRGTVTDPSAALVREPPSRSRVMVLLAA